MRGVLKGLVRTSCACSPSRWVWSATAAHSTHAQEVPHARDVYIPTSRHVKYRIVDIAVQTGECESVDD